MRMLDTTSGHWPSVPRFAGMPRAPPCHPAVYVGVRSASLTSQVLTRSWSVGGTCALIFPAIPPTWGRCFAGCLQGLSPAAAQTHWAEGGSAAAYAWLSCWVRAPGLRAACWLCR
eukprot:12885093-Prorocentrum_lima.AAC.1